MQMKLALLLCALLAPALMADEIRYRAGDRTEIAAGVVTAWSWKEVSYKAAGSTGKVARKDLISVSRTSENGSLSANLSSALSAAANDPARAMMLLEREANSGDAVNKEDATYQIADLTWSTAQGDKRKLQAAVDKFKAYIAAYKDGYYADQAYVNCGMLQARLGDIAGARATYQAMIRVGSGLDLIGAMELGQLEFNAKQYGAAVNAFKDAAKAAGSDKTARYKANAWQAKALSANKDAAAARPLLEEIVKDSAFNDPTTPDGDEVMSLAYANLGTIYFDSKSFEQAYDACMMAAFYAWWLQGEGEGNFLALAWRAAKKSSVGADQWKTRADKLAEVLAAAHPKVWKDAQEAAKND